MSERKLATIRKIKDLSPIPGADRIELATVDGWKVVAEKGLHNVGDLVVYCEVDSFLPIRDEFEFLRKSSYKKMSDGSEGFRLKTIKLRGQISQGLILPLKVINEGSNIQIHSFWEGMDVTEILNIKKYEPPIPAELAGDVEGAFPSYIKKTDEERVQNLTNEYEGYKEKIYYVTEKLDGTSVTFFVKDDHFGICSRNWELKESGSNTFWKFARLNNLENKLKGLGYNIAIQGECIGEGIQKNQYKLIGQTVRFFSVFDIDNYRYVDFEKFKEVINELDLKTVPIIDENFELPETVDDLLLYANDKSILNTGTKREGVVIRSHDLTVSFKVISNEHLLENE